MPEATPNRLTNESLAVIESEHAARGLPPDPVVLEKMLDYVEAFPERLHHPHEDEHLFRGLRARTDDMLDRLEAEHESGARRLAELRTALAEWKARGASALAPLATLLDAYMAGYLSHMNTEERWILPAARAHLTSEDWQAIHAAFCAEPDPLTGTDAQAAFTRMFHEIARLAPPPIGVG